MYDWCCYFLRIIIECVKILMFSCLLFGRNLSKEKWKYIISGVGIIGVCSIEGIFRGYADELMIMIMPIGVSIFILTEKIKGRLFSVLLSYMLVNIFDNIYALIIAVILYGTNMSYEERITMLYSVDRILMLNAIVILIYWIVLQLIARYRKNKEQNVKVNNQFILLLIIDCVICCLTVGGTQALLFPSVSKRLKTIIAVGIMVMCFILIIQCYIQNKLYNSRNHYKEIMENQEKYIEEKRKYYAQQEENYHTMLKYKHDINKHLNCIYSLIEQNNQDEVKKYISQMQEDSDVKIPFVNCGNVIVSSIVTEYAAKAQKMDIRYECKGHCPENVKVTEMDLCTLIGNGLENALEACSTVQGDKFIDVELMIEGDYTIIEIKNSCVHRSIEKNKKLKTAKDERNHGIGIKNIISAVNKYNGNVEWWCDNYIFTLQIII